MTIIVSMEHRSSIGRRLLTQNLVSINLFPTSCSDILCSSYVVKL